ncbi:hypothetical protein QV13_05370 [Mesorhizobium hungaricum]|uniref:Uncharacterized protein n=1 Tax=Mesorhizobium hungaricum TaxID=1566387 RepID=A0A1C2E7I3_9HYPH|nr:hypothetical protein QV13_05370 [Mesorhizobium hungaricum]
MALGEFERIRRRSCRVVIVVGVRRHVLDGEQLAASRDEADGKGHVRMRIQNTRSLGDGQEKSIPGPTSSRNMSPWAICSGVLATGTSARMTLPEK